MGQSDVPIRRPCPRVNFPEIEGNLMIYVSPLLRCLQTVEIFIGTCGRNGFSLPVVIDVNEGLKERALGLFEGRRKSEVYEEFAEVFNEGTMLPYFCPPAGEPFSGFSRRVALAYNDIILALERSHVLVCTHLQVLRMITCLHRGLDIQESWAQIKYSHGQIVRLE